MVHKNLLVIGILFILVLNGSFVVNGKNIVKSDIAKNVDITKEEIIVNKIFYSPDHMFKYTIFNKDFL